MSYSARAGRTNRHNYVSYRRGAKIAVRSAAAASIEMLESRLMLTAVAWLGGTGNFNIAANWSDDAIPNTIDDVTIAVAGSVVNVTDSEDVASVTTTAGATVKIADTGTLD